jgi:hypothetical protein
VEIWGQCGEDACNRIGTLSPIDSTSMLICSNQRTFSRKTRDTHALQPPSDLAPLRTRLLPWPSLTVIVRRQLSDQEPELLAYVLAHEDLLDIVLLRSDSAAWAPDSASPKGLRQPSIFLELRKARIRTRVHSRSRGSIARNKSARPQTVALKSACRGSHRHYLRFREPSVN